MAGRGRGRGRGLRVPSTAPLREPEPDTVARLVGNFVADPDTCSAEGQFADVTPPQRTGQSSLTSQQQQQREASTATNGNTPSQQPDGNEENPGSTRETVSAGTSLLASEIKAALKEGTKEATPHTQELTTPALMPTKLNPAAQPFSPLTSASQSQLNPSSAEFLPSTTPYTPTMFPTKQIPSSTLTPQNQKTPQSSSLNPNSQEFVPRGTTLNVAATEFIPKIGLPPSMQNGNPNLPESADDLDVDLLQLDAEVSVPFLEPQSIVDGFERVVVQKEGEDGNLLLKLVAEILIKATMYPGSFESHKTKIEEAIKKLSPNHDTMRNLSEMIVHWGISEPGLRYTASRLCQVLCEVPAIPDFNKILMRRLQAWYEKQREVIIKTAAEREAFINFAFFYAEAFARVRLNNSPVNILGTAIFELVQKLFSLQDEKMVMGGCSILKLTGALLEGCEKAGSTKKMDQVVLTLKELAIDENLSSHCQDLVIRVIQLQAQKWGRRMTSPPPTSTSTPTHPHQPSSLHELIFNSGREMPVQPPVTNPDDWNEYLNEDDLVEDTDAPDFLPEELQFDSEGMDPEMEEEFEAFIDEIEEHLLMQDFDPDIPHNVPDT